MYGTMMLYFTLADMGHTEGVQFTGDRRCKLLNSRRPTQISLGCLLHSGIKHDTKVLFLWTPRKGETVLRK
jgi:hypothetical protein